MSSLPSPISFTMPELLAPAGSLDKLKIAIHYGADAVYLGGGNYSLRAHAVLGREGLAEAVAYAHTHNVKCYITINIFAHNRDLENLAGYLLFLKDIKVDGLIIADPGIFSIARATLPNMPIHISTQANITNKASALFWQNLGAERVNLARELSRQEIAEIRQATTLKLETFVHGAICISYSGRCSLSLYMTGRSANHGNCAHPCRYRYKLEEQKRPDQFFPVEQDERGTYIFNSKDLCLLRRLPELIASGSDSLKLEGRMKSIYYVGAVVRLYRAALSYIKQQYEAGVTDPSQIIIPPEYTAELQKIGSRGYTENFFDKAPNDDEMLYKGVSYEQTHAPIGVVRKTEEGKAPIIEIRSPVNQGDMVEYLGMGIDQNELTIVSMTNDKGELVERANPGNLISMRTTPPFSGWEENALVRKGIAASSK